MLQLVSSLSAIILILAVSAILHRIVYLFIFHPLRTYKGPYLAAFTDLWRYLYVRNHRERVLVVDLHAQYGNIVRAGPNKLSFADPGALKQICGINKGFVKV